MPYNKTARNRKNKKSNKNKNKTMRKTRGGKETKPQPKKQQKHLMKLNVFITPKQDGVDKRKIEYDIRTYEGFFDYLNEADTFLKNILNEEKLLLEESR